MPTDPELSVRPPRRPLPLRYFIAALIGVFALPIVIWMVWGWIEASRLDRRNDLVAARDRHGVAGRRGRAGHRHQRLEVAVPAREREQDPHR